MPTVIVAVISFAAYATGAVLARRRLPSRISPPVDPMEVLIVSGGLLLIVALPHAASSLAYVLVCALLGVLLGAITATATLARNKGGGGGTREFEDIRAPARSTNAWKRWVSFTRSVADYEIRLLLVACYLLIIGPLAVAHRLSRATPAYDRSPSNWLTRSDTATLDAARRSF